MNFILFVIALINGLNGVLMIVLPNYWYKLTPGANETGPFNHHFVQDVGIAFLVAALGIAWAAMHSGAVRNTALALSASFLGGHALLHLIELTHHPVFLLRDLLLIIIPGLLPMILLGTSLKGERK